jgi:hypothetical protein
VYKTNFELKNTMRLSIQAGAAAFTLGGGEMK